VEVIVHPLSVLRRELVSAAGLAGMVAAAARDGYRLRRLVRDRGVALLHSNTSVVLSGFAAAAASRVPHVCHVREIYPGSGFERAWPVYRRMLATATALPCVSAATAAQFGGMVAGVRVIGDGVAVARGRAQRSAARAALGLTLDVPAIAVLGRISSWKGQDLLVRALAQPELAAIGTVALIAGAVWPGADDRLAAVTSLTAELGVQDRVRLLGFRDDVETVYGAADLVAVPSIAPDPLPGAAIEAAAAGCAVIAADHGGLPEIVRDGVTGRLFPPGDAAALARVARALLDDPAARERLGAAAAADVCERFAPARLLYRVQALYDEVLA
jgi:glycosyltransferase involved in cell wall biosynthesis